VAKKANIRIVRPGERPAYDRENANHGVLRRTTAIMLVCGILLFGVWGPGYREASFIYFQF
jgi:hypothetical protein